MRLSIQGELDIASAPLLQSELGHAESSSPKRIVLDLTALDFIDSTGIRLLINAQSRADRNGHVLVLTHVPAHAERLFEITGIESRLLIE